MLNAQRSALNAKKVQR